MASFFPRKTDCIIALILRVSFGLSLFLVGLSHYLTFKAFQSMTADGLGPLESLGSLWAFILPALMIIGGALFVIGLFREIAVWTAGVALGSIPAGMLLKPVLSGASLAIMIEPVINAFIWMIVLALVVKMSERNK